MWILELLGWHQSLYYTKVELYLAKEGGKVPPGNQRRITLEKTNCAVHEPCNSLGYVSIQPPMQNPKV